MLKVKHSAQQRQR